MLVKGNSKPDIEVAEHLTIKTTSQLCLFCQSIDLKSERLTVSFTYKSNVVDSIIIPLQPNVESNGESHTVEIFGSSTKGFDVGDEAAAFFSKHLKQPVRLLYIGQFGHRAVPAPSLVPQIRCKITSESSSNDQSWFGGLLSWRQTDAKTENETMLHPQQIRFNDGSPLLLTTTSSEEDARSRLPDQCSDEDILVRFRTNIHIDVSLEADFKPYDEDNWKKISIKCQSDDHSTDRDVELDVVFRTPRCQSLNVDFDTGGLVAGERQLYKLLARDRRVNPAFPLKPCFGVYAFAVPIGAVLRVGDTVSVIRSA